MIEMSNSLAQVLTQKDRQIYFENSPIAQKSKIRFFALSCLLYGGAPQEFEFIAQTANYDRAQRRNCQTKSQQVATGVRQLLNPHLR
jgi:hypothetical protein